MTTLLLNTILVLITILFGAMAYYPLFVNGNDTELKTQSVREDHVISVSLVAAELQRPTALGSACMDDSQGEHPGQQPAA